ncbi:MAG: alpha/beta hydrolase [Pseudomonadota bacterium]
MKHSTMIAPASHSLTAALSACGLAVMLATAPLAAQAAVPDCHVGAYRLGDGSFVDIGPSVGSKLRWRRFDGTTGALTKGEDGSWNSTRGWTERADGKKVWFSDCAEGEIKFDGAAGKRIPFEVTETSFENAGVKLAARLVMPKGSGKVPVVVLLHGSENTSARDFFSLQRLLPAEGIGVLVFDKRGTGASGGKYTQDFSLLADDAVAAIREARKLAGARAGRVGYQAGSQGGWIAPIAASRTPVDFVIVSFGLAVTVLDEDREAGALDMTRHGFGPDAVAKAQEITDAAAAMAVTGFTKNIAQFDAVRNKYRNEPWYKYLQGNYVNMVLPVPAEQITEKAKELDVGTPWNYDPMPTLRALNTPQLWIQGDEDLAAPYAETRRRLLSLAALGKPVTTALYAGADHGIYEFELAPDGEERLSTRNSDGYNRMMRDYIFNGKLQGSYGKAQIEQPKN